MKKTLHDYTFLLGIAAIVIIPDQITKYLVRSQLEFGESWVPWDWLAPYARIVHWQNTGAAFGMLQGYNLVFSLLAIIVSIAILFYFPRVPREEWFLRLAMGLQLGGAVGNLIDRLIAGEVTDFISVGRFPVWNIADASITIGVVVLLLGFWIKDLAEKQAIKRSPAQSLPDMPTPEDSRE